MPALRQPLIEYVPLRWASRRLRPAPKSLDAHREKATGVGTGEFQGGGDALRQFSDASNRTPNRKLRRQLWRNLLLALARDLVTPRSNRTEPSAVKCRSQPLPLLNKPRRQFVAIFHRSRYWKGRPRNYRGRNLTAIRDWPLHAYRHDAAASSAISSRTEAVNRARIFGTRQRRCGGWVGCGGSCVKSWG